MRISTKKLTELYKAIDGEISDYRIQIMRERMETFSPSRVEKDLFYLSNRVWHRVSKVLGVQP